MLGCCGMKITDGGVRHNDRGANHNARLLWYTPGGLMPMIKLLWLTPPGRTTTGGLMKTLHRQGIFLPRAMWAKPQNSFPKNLR